MRYEALPTTLSLAGLSDVVSWFGARAGARTDSFRRTHCTKMHSYRAVAKFIVYGHTHHHAIVPLRSVQQGNDTVDALYINSGTWRLSTRAGAVSSGRETVRVLSRDDLSRVLQKR